jgi:UDP-N-acetylglucosamine 2-epimerase
MPEEYNRIVADHCADMLFCPTPLAVNNLSSEGITQGVHRVGDTMYDLLLQYCTPGRPRSNILNSLKIQPKGYLLATLHRPYNVDKPHILSKIIRILQEIDEPIVFPVHPRTRKQLLTLDDASKLLSTDSRLMLIEPVGYLDMLTLEQHARIILTDSGGIQKEAYMHAVPCITLRSETEWKETVSSGWNVLAGTQKKVILKAVSQTNWPQSREALFGNGDAAAQIVKLLIEEHRG